MATHKILLIEDVDHVGKSGDLVSVKPGFARNFLLPKGHAVFADKAAIKRQAKLQEKRRLKSMQDRKEAEEIAKRLSEVVIEVSAKADDKGDLYGSVTQHEIVSLLLQQASVELEKRALLLKTPIKKVGSHTISVKLIEDVPASFVLKVTQEEKEQGK